jgi:hypothetical protein
MRDSSSSYPIPPFDGKNTFFLLMTLNIDSEPKAIIERKVLLIIEHGTMHMKRVGHHY